MGPPFIIPLERRQTFILESKENSAPVLRRELSSLKKKKWEAQPIGNLSRLQRLDVSAEESVFSRTNTVCEEMKLKIMNNLQRK